MAFFILVILTVRADLKIESPDSFNGKNILTHPALFGNPTFYGIYGKIKEVHQCQVLELLEFETIVLLTNTTGCCIFAMAKEVENKGGRGLIVVQDFPRIMEKDCDGEDSYIMVIGISFDSYKNFFKHKKTVWITYQYEIYPTMYPYIEVKFTGNVTSDLVLVKSLMKLHMKYTIPWQYIKLYAMCEASSTDPDTECMKSEKEIEFCMNTQENYTGKAKIAFYQQIFAFVQNYRSQNATSIILNFLNSAFSDCSYNLTCLSNLVQSYDSSPTSSSRILDLYFIFESRLGRIILNSIDIYWPESLESAFCLAFIRKPGFCEYCSPGCTFTSLESANCSIFCDNLHCGFSYLNCQRSKGCYKFMFGDGNCNEMCIEDPDCNQDKEYLRFFMYSVIACCFVIFLV